MFPIKGKNDLFKNLAAGWKQGQKSEAMKEAAGVPPAVKMPTPGGAPGASPNGAPAPQMAQMPHNLPTMPGMADGLPAPAQQGAPRAMLPMPHNPMLQQSPWMGMKA